MRPHQRVAAADHALDKLVHEGILGPAQGREVQPRRGQECVRIDAAAMGRIEDRRPAPFDRFENFERKVELVFHFAHGTCSPSCGGSGDLVRRRHFHHH
jgi:hypothetical protein